MPGFPGAIVEPAPREDPHEPPRKPDFVRQDEQGWQVPDSVRWRPDDEVNF